MRAPINPVPAAGDAVGLAGLALADPSRAALISSWLSRVDGSGSRRVIGFTPDGGGSGLMEAVGNSRMSGSNSRQMARICWTTRAAAAYTALGGRPSSLAVSLIARCLRTRCSKQAQSRGVTRLLT